MAENGDEIVRETKRVPAKWQDKVAAAEVKWANGFVKVGGKHVAAQGLISRKGYIRITPNNDDNEWIEISKPDRLDELECIAAEVLHGRTATVFEGLVLAPLRGQSKRTVEELAYQFNVSRDRIYRITDRAKRKIIDKLRVSRKQSEDQDGRPLPPPELDAYREGKSKEKCPTCGRVYAWKPLHCAVGQSHARPECLHALERGRALDRKMAEYEKKWELWRETHGRIYSARESARFLAERAAVDAEMEALHAKWRQAEAELELFGEQEPADADPQK